MRNKNDKVVLLAMLIGAGVLALASGAGVWYLQKESAELETQNSALQTRVAQAQTKISKLPQLRAQREESEVRLRVAERILPSQEEIETLVDNLSAFAERSGVVITKAAPVRQVAYGGPGGSARPFEEANFDLDLKGDYFQYVEFLNLLENYKRFIRVDSFTISPGRSQDESLGIDLKFATFTYVGSTTKGGTQ